MRLRTTGLVLAASLVAIALAVPLHDASASLGKQLATPINPSDFKTGHTSGGAGAVPVAGDFDGDGHADVFWYRPGPSADVMWWGTGSTATLGSVHDEYVVNGSYLPRTGDFNGDHHTDIAWPVKNGSSYHFDVWFGRNDRTFRSEMGSVPNAGTSRYFTGDFNGDGYDDVFTYVAGQGNVVYFGA